MNMNLSSLKRWKNSDILGGTYSDKNLVHLPRQCLRDGEKALILMGFLDENVKFTPYLHLWKIGSVVKTCGD